MQPNKSSESYEVKWQKLKSGLLSGVVSCYVTQPLEVIKTAIMVNPSKNQNLETRNPLITLRTASIEIWRHEGKGIKNFFRGAVISCVRQSLGFGLYSFFLTELNERVVNKATSTSGSFIYFFYGLSASITKIGAVSLTSPLGLLKTRKEVIAKGSNQSSLSIAREVIASENLKGLYRGTTPILFREALYSFAHYSTYQMLKNDFKDKINSTVNSFVSPFIAGVIALTISHPFEVIRNRMQANNKYLEDSKIYSGPLEALKKIYKNEGVYGYFTGFIPRLFRKPINSGITWLLYDLFTESDFKKPES